MTKAPKGFSLIELLLYITIFCLLAKLALVNVRFLQSAIVHAELDLLQNTCFYLQQLALTTGRTQELIFDENKEGYNYKNCNHQFPPQIKLGTLAHAKGPPSAPTHPLPHPVTFDHNKIMFYPDGTISAGTVYFVDRDQNCLYALSSGIAHISFLRTYYYDGKWHLI